MIQLPLGIRLREDVTFDNFLFGEANREVKHTLSEGKQPFVYLWGPRGSGKSHLLQAMMHHAAGRQEAAAYLPLGKLDKLSPDYLQGLEQLPLICIDDIDHAAGHTQWEEALFHLYNRARVAETRLVVTAGNSPLNTPIHLPDLRSRLGWGMTLRLTPLDDDGKLAVLQQRARARGMELPPEVGRYLLRRISRDMESISTWLERLDEQSLADQRKLTIPFVRNLLAGGKAFSPVTRHNQRLTREQ